MGCNDQECRDRVYLPSQQDGVDVKDYLLKYIEREFPEAKDGKNAVYSVPSKFKNCGEKQASLAEEVVFTRLSGLVDTTRLDGLWMTFFHSASYAGHSFRNQRVGKLMIREHDFVIFVKYKGRYFVALAEVKSTYDGTKAINNVNVTSDAKVIKNNKRSAQHQLRDHMEVLQGVLEINLNEHLIECFIMWPFLSALTRDPKQQIIKRWKEDSNLHVFENNLSDQNSFNQWFIDNIINSTGISENHFITLLNRYIILSCGIFVDEINQGMLALLNKEQLEVLTDDTCTRPGRGPLVVHGAAGTGKTLLVLRKLEQLFKSGDLNAQNRALYICYWPGIRCDFEQKLKLLGMDELVDTSRFYISQTGFLLRNKKVYKHIFMDEAEAVCLSFDGTIITKTLSTIFQRYHDGNCTITTCIKCNNNLSCAFNDCESIQRCVDKKWGELWFLVDINQASLFLPKHSPQVLKTPAIVLNKVMRSTGYIFNIFKQYYSDPMPKLPKSVLLNMNLNNIQHGHHILGPPVFWVNIEENKTRETVANVIIDLCATKGFKPNDVCIIPFLVNDNFAPKAINEEIDNHFVENGYRPRGVGDVESFINNKAVNDFLISWALRVKGLEFKVVLMVVEDGDFDVNDSEDRRKSYIIASRCTCLLILISPKSVKHEIDLYHAMENYPFSLQYA